MAPVWTDHATMPTNTAMVLTTAAAAQLLWRTSGATDGAVVVTTPASRSSRAPSTRRAPLTPALVPPLGDPDGSVARDVTPGALRVASYRRRTTWCRPWSDTLPGPSTRRRPGQQDGDCRRRPGRRRAVAVGRRHGRQPGVEARDVGQELADPGRDQRSRR